MKAVAAKPLRLIAILAVTLGILVAGTWGAVKITTDHLLYRDATATARNWARVVAESVPDLEQIANGEQPSTASMTFFRWAQKTGQVFRYEIYNPEGYSQLVSDHGIAMVNLSQFSADAVRSLQSNQPLVDVTESTAPGRPAFFARAYVPVVVSGRAIAIVAAYVDQTEQRDRFYRAFLLAAVLLCLLTALAFTLPAIAWYRKHRRLAQREEELRAHNVRFDTALNNMSQGLCMFDAEQRLVVSNDRYAQMYGLKPEQVKPGMTLREIVQARIEIGVFAGPSADEYVNKIVDARQAAAGPEPSSAGSEVDAPITASSNHVRQLNDGRFIAIANRPMAGGGWVATHEDITESRRRDETFALLFMSSPIPMWVYDHETLQFLAVNNAAIAHYGYSEEQFLGMTLLDIRPAEEREKFLKLVQPYKEGGDGERSSRHRKSDGTGIDVAIYARSLTYEGRPARLVAAHDVTAQKIAEDELRRTRTFLDTIIEHVPATIIVKDAHEHRFVLINRAGEEFFGIPRDSMIGKNAHELYSAEQAEFVMTRDKDALKIDGPVIIDDHMIKTPGHGIRVVLSKKLAIRDAKGEPQYLLTVIDDVTERKRAERQIAHMAHHDGLTNLPNRVRFHAQLEQALAATQRGKQVALLYLDLDEFKKVNDTLGHPVGDELLKVVADRLRCCVRESDTIARLGGDEFAVIHTELTEPLDAARLAVRIREAITTPLEISGHTILLDTSIGIALAPHDAADSDQLLRCADMALYGAKADGRGAYRFFEREMNTRVNARRSIELDLRKAISDGEFVLHYQPLLDLKSDEISGCEALIRWKHPIRGMIAPAEFISVAEETGLIVPLGEWALRQACADAARWPDNIKVAVNISPVQLRRQNITATVVNALAAAGLPANRLEIEITEAVLMDDSEENLATLHQLRRLGVRIAMDDFGTGYSSLSYLRSFPFDKIKIDHSFIQGLSAGGDAVAIVEAITRLAHSLKLAITAEGVETEQQLQKVRELGCTEIQGYIVSKPRPVAELTSLFYPRKSAKIVRLA